MKMLHGRVLSVMYKRHEDAAQHVGFVFQRVPTGNMTINYNIVTYKSQYQKIAHFTNQQ